MPVVDGKFDSTTLSKDGSAYEKLKASIERNAEFNKKLASDPVITPSLLDIRMARISQILRDKGMDSQQREQAIQMIREVIE